MADKRPLPLAVAALTFLLYALTLSRNPSGDSLGIALGIWWERYLFDPTHLLIHPLGWLFYQPWRLAGWSEGPLFPGQVLNAAAGALCAALVAALAGRLTGSRSLAALAGLGFALSGGAWLLSTDAEYATVSLALALLVLWALLAAPILQASRPRYAVLLALGTGLAIFGYLSSALLVPVVVTGLLLDERLDPPLRRRQVRLYLAVLLLAVLPVYGAVVAVWGGAGGASPPLAAWLRPLANYARVAPLDLGHGVYSLLRSLALFPQLWLYGSSAAFLRQVSTGQQAGFVAYYLLVLVLAVAPLALVWTWRRKLWPRQRRPLVVLAVWAACYSLFAVLWVPGDLTFWLPVLASWWLLVALVLERAGQRALVIAAGLTLALTVVNLTVEILPRHDLARNRYLPLALAIRDFTAPGDAVLTRGDDPLGLYAVYYSGRLVNYANAAGDLDRALEALAAQPGSPPRLYLVDSDSSRLAWWLALVQDSAAVQAGQWQVASPGWARPGQAVVELAPANPP